MRIYWTLWSRIIAFDWRSIVVVLLVTLHDRNPGKLSMDKDVYTEPGPRYETWNSFIIS